jgi:hypothetical protein
LQSRVRGTVFAVNLNLGVANLFNPTDRNGDGVIDDVDQTLPISERFFTGGSTTLRGFAFEEAGPRLAVCPTGSTLGSQINVQNCAGGVFRNSSGDPVTLNPFTVPVGGNAMAVAKLRGARAPDEDFPDRAVLRRRQRLPPHRRHLRTQRPPPRRHHQHAQPARPVDAHRRPRPARPHAPSARSA